MTRPPKRIRLSNEIVIERNAFGSFNLVESNKEHKQVIIMAPWEAKKLKSALGKLL
jgi:hypothetical protein